MDDSKFTLKQLYTKTKSIFHNYMPMMASLMLNTLAPTIKTV